MYPTTLTEIANLGLESIGCDPIASIDASQLKPQKTVRTHIFQVIRFIQSKHDWPELRTGYTLKAADTPSIDGGIRYGKPTNFLTATKTISGYQITEENGYLLTDDPDPKMFYVRYDENVSIWSNALVECVFTELAARCSPRLVQSPLIRRDARMIADRTLRKMKGEKIRSNNRGLKWSGGHGLLNLAKHGVRSSGPGFYRERS